MTILQKYIKHLLKFKGINPKYSDVMIAILDVYKTTCISQTSLKFILSKSGKEDVAGATGLSVSRINHIIADFIKAELMQRVSNGTYVLNKIYFCCNEFNQVKEIKATYDYVTKSVKVKFVSA